MEFGPIFRALLHNKARFWLIAVEVALTLAIVANCVNWMLDLRNEYMADTGMDIENVLIVYTQPWAPEFKDEDFVDVTREDDIARLKAFPGVISAAGIHQVPLSGGGSATGRKPLDAEMDTMTAPYFVVTEDILDALGVELAAGRTFNQGDYDERTENRKIKDETIPQHYNVILSQGMADAMYPDGDALGKQIQSGGGERINTIVGITKEMHNSWPGSSVYNRVMLIPGRPGDAERMRYAVRVEPDAVETVYTEIEELMLGLNPGRIVTVRTLREIKDESHEVNNAVVKMLSGVIGLLILVTSLGIVGLTSSSVAQRIRQIGTRRALGATKGDIVRYFLVENWVITGFGLVFGVGMTYGLNYLLVQVADTPKMDFGLMVAGVVLLWITGVLAALAPALKATSVSPEVATRSV
jgi:putative ABC transport system permease protein